jgi:hypothetical protein
VFVAYYASAELGCFRALGWPMPANIIDLFVEFRDRTNHIAQRRKPGVKPPGARLIDALALSASQPWWRTIYCAATARSTGGSRDGRTRPKPMPCCMAHCIRRSAGTAILVPIPTRDR